MKIETKEVKTYKTFYIAGDGTQFSDRAECEKYEKTASCAIESAFIQTFKTDDPNHRMLQENVPLAECSENTLVAVRVKNEEQLQVFNRWLLDRQMLSTALGADAIGKTHIIEEPCYDNERYYWFTTDELRKRCDNMIGFFEGRTPDPNMPSLDAVLGWISEHETLAVDFKNHFGVDLSEE